MRLKSFSLFRNIHVTYTAAVKFDIRLKICIPSKPFNDGNKVKYLHNENP